MKMTKKIASLVLALVMLFSAIPFVNASETSSIEKYKNDLYEQGIAVMSTDEFSQLFDIIYRFVFLLTGVEIETRKFDVAFTGAIVDVTEEICNASGLDLQLIAKNLPDISFPARLADAAFPVNTAAVRTEFFELRDSFNAQGKGTLASICNALGAYMRVITKCEFFTEATSEDDVYRLMLTVSYKDGTTEDYYAGILINTRTGDCYNESGTGMLGTGYNFNFYEAMVYTTVDCWMRNFGFCEAYDIIATTVPVVFNYETRRFRFEYDGLEWMIQVWKGNYSISNGAEIGVYNRNPEKAFGTFYKCATEDQQLEMALKLYKDDKLLLSRPLESHWWISGFNLSTRLYVPSTLTVDATIIFPDEEMCEAFVAAVEAEANGDVTCSASGRSVHLVW